MIVKGTEQYKAASKLANEIKKIEGFASKVATTIDSSMNPYNRLVAIISDKQAWILACCAIENNINL